jgi:hypothetical protein
LSTVTPDSGIISRNIYILSITPVFYFLIPPSVSPIVIVIISLCLRSNHLKVNNGIIFDLLCSDRYQSGDTSAGSSCSITSGTPSTDIRLSEYPLDKVTTYFLPDEDIAPTERQGRAYSVGSRPVNNNTR